MKDDSNLPSDKVKHELRIQIYELRVPIQELQVEVHEL